MKEILLHIAGDAVLFDEPLAKYSTMNIGGKADAVVFPKDVEALKNIVGFCVEEEIPYIFLGAGSNTLIRDNGIRGVIVHLKEGFDDFFVSFEREGDVFVTAGAGLRTAKLVQLAAQQGLSGLEGLAGIPGTVGGNVLTNAGTSLGSIADAIDEITVLNKQQREVTIKRKGLEFSYRNLKMPRSNGVLRAQFKLKRDNPDDIHKRITQLLEKRKATQPYNMPTLGCVFRNPSFAVRRSLFVEPCINYERRATRHYCVGGQASDERRFLSAGKLIEEVGLKGVRVGKARISDMHANFIVNEGGATARDVEILIDLVKEKVKQRFGVSLELEINIIGEV